MPRSFPFHFCLHPHCLEPGHMAHHTERKTRRCCLWPSWHVPTHDSITVEVGENEHWGQLVVLLYPTSLQSSLPLQPYLFPLSWSSSHTNFLAHSLLSPPGHRACAVLHLKYCSLDLYMTGSFSSFGSQHLPRHIPWPFPPKQSSHFLLSLSSPCCFILFLTLIPSLNSHLLIC